jgi:hypothetical protein
VTVGAHVAKNASPPAPPRHRRPGTTLVKNSPWVPRFALIAIAALAGLSYAWALNRDPLEPYYAASVRSMSMSWHDFFFGAFDPAGTITLDKLPGAFWVQALAVRAFGVHTWAIVLPQASKACSPCWSSTAPSPAGRARGRPDRRRRGGGEPGHRGPRPGQHLRHPDDPAGRAGRRRRHQCPGPRAPGHARRGRGLGRPGLPGEDDRGLDAPARLRPGVPAVRSGVDGPARPPAAGRRRRRRGGLAVVDDRGLARAGLTPSLCRREPQRLGLRAGLRLQRVRPLRRPDAAAVAGRPVARPRAQPEDPARRAEPVAARRLRARHGLAAPGRARRGARGHCQPAGQTAGRSAPGLLRAVGGVAGHAGRRLLVDDDDQLVLHGRPDPGGRRPPGCGRQRGLVAGASGGGPSRVDAPGRAGRPGGRDRRLRGVAGRRSG